MARELARLMDAMEIEDVDPARMQSLVPDAFAEHWERTLAFLRIVTEAWPAHLEEHGLVSKMQHDKQLVLAQAQRLREKPPDAPVIVAGVMSSVPAVTELLGVVAGLPNGALVLPGLDQALDERAGAASCRSTLSTPSSASRSCWMRWACGARTCCRCPDGRRCAATGACRTRGRGDAARPHDRALAPVHGRS